MRPRSPRPSTCVVSVLFYSNPELEGACTADMVLSDNKVRVAKFDKVGPAEWLNVYKISHMVAEMVKLGSESAQPCIAIVSSGHRSSFIHLDILLI